jgi:hypothetical protein
MIAQIKQPRIGVAGTIKGWFTTDGLKSGCSEHRSEGRKPLCRKGLSGLSGDSGLFGDEIVSRKKCTRGGTPSQPFLYPLLYMVWGV